MKHFFLKFFLVVSVFIAGNLSAQDFSIKADIDSSFLFIGEQASLSFEVKQPRNIKITPPLFSDSIISGIEIVERKNPDTVQMDNERMTVVHSFVITSFDTALYYVPPFPFVDEKGDTVESNPLSLKVFTVPVDTTQFQLAEIKPVYNPPFDWAGFFLTILYVVLALLGAFALYWIIRRLIQRKKIFAIEKKEPEQPAHIIALEHLDQIKNEKIWQKGQTKQYYTELTDVIRVYIGKRYDLSAMESTSDEILLMLKPVCEQKEAVKMLRELLKLSDLVKFAKFQPLPDEFLKSLSEAYYFVNETKQEEILPDSDSVDSEIDVAEKSEK